MHQIWLTNPTSNEHICMVNLYIFYIPVCAVRVLGESDIMQEFLASPEVDSVSLISIR